MEYQTTQFESTVVDCLNHQQTQFEMSKTNRHHNIS